LAEPKSTASKLNKYELTKSFMTKLFYFKVTFLSISAGLFIGSFVYGLFDADFSNSDAILKLAFKSLVTGIAVGFVLGILNMFFKIGIYQKKENEN
jgi:hypothetical protein